MRVDLSIISVLDGKHDVHSAAFQDIIFKTEIPCRHLENVKDVFGDLVFWNIWVHYILERPHFVHAFFVLRHEILLNQYFFIKKAFVASVSFE